MRIIQNKSPELKRIIMTQNKNKMIRNKTERNIERNNERSTERQEQKGENARFLPIFYWTD